ncbi:hypothetical protein A8990_101251 [Paenibacillus taihuensis]|uniref:Uncharacterized protein n=1 Tax=Paenibacillus taihuensis TaxID=1156355 RepID=A0A3D9SFN1_9BACL|nr:hypothetical protein A8990_101251 [Paenibacillus taihuensis]
MLLGCLFLFRVVQVRRRRTSPVGTIGICFDGRGTPTKDFPRSWQSMRSSGQPESLRAAIELGMLPRTAVPIEAFQVQQRPQAHPRTERQPCPASMPSFPAPVNPNARQRPLLSPHHGYGIIFLVMLMIRPFRRRVGKPTLYVLSAPFSLYGMWNNRILLGA